MKPRHTARKPRNPLVAPARFRRAGAHRDRRAIGRAAARTALRKDIDAFKKGP